MAGQFVSREGQTGDRLTDHFCKTSCCYNVASVHQTIEVSGRLFYGFAHLIIAVKIEDIGDKIKGILIILDFGV